MSNPLEWIGEVGKAIGGLFDLASEAIPDKDKQAELRVKLSEIQSRLTESVIALQTKIEELQAQITIAALNSNLPTWAKVAHLLGRQVFSYVLVLAYWLSHVMGKPISVETLMVIAAPGTAYTLLKGKGR